MNILINYANEVFADKQQLNSKTGIEIGLFDKVISYSPRDIDKAFYLKNKHILKSSRGDGYWLWKPYFIKKSLDAVNTGDFVFYCDSGSHFIKPITPLIDISIVNKQDIIAFELAHIEKIWTKRDAFYYMDCDESKYYNSQQILGSFSLWRKSALSMDFVNEWLNYAQDDKIITDLDNQCGLPNYPKFQDHRHDQSIFSLLIKKYNLEVYRDPSQYGNNETQNYHNSKYKQLIQLTRKGKITFFKKVSNKILAKIRMLSR